jgi:SAM-dependent methyltransferase
MSAKADKVRGVLLPSVELPTQWEHYMHASPWDPRALLRRHPRAYALMHDLITPTVQAGAWRREVPDPATHVVVNLGCGYRVLHPEMINVDLVALPHVDVPADLRQPLPFRSASVDAVVSIAVLEHLADPSALVAEMARILKPGGVCHLACPFFYPFHAAPADYHRWTVPGLRGLVEPHFDVERSGPRGGAAGVFILLAAHLLAQALSLGSATAYGVVNYAAMVLLSPLKLFDLVLARLPFTATLCPNVYVTARRR